MIIYQVVDGDFKVNNDSHECLQIDAQGDLRKILMEYNKKVALTCKVYQI